LTGVGANGGRVRIWFWAWVIAAAAIAAVSALARDRFSAPWAAGAASAAALEAMGIDPSWQWIAFLFISGAIFVAVNRVRYAGRHIRGGSGGGNHS
jgi:membrane protein implicated in regulation of membrane protease activity